MNADELARLQIIMTIIVTVANVFLVILTSIYVYLTRQMVNETKANRDPTVFVDLEFPEREARVAIGNSGQTPAVNIKFDVQEDVPWRGLGKYSEGLKGLEVIKNGVSYLPSNRILKYSAGIPEWDKVDEEKRLLKINVSYYNESGKKFEREYFIDLLQYKGILFESFRDSNMAIAKAIRDTEQSQRSRERGDDMLRDMGSHRVSEKRCSMCAELIPREAKICSHCGEVLDSKVRRITNQWTRGGNSCSHRRYRLKP
ncbi:MAG: zinc ribbon domain-containing protein [Acidobacteria bacterium]|jgi:hypothetical protein|nr:zinc ribbon domain-containing protein [Acidobacteriota bacterium]